MTDKKIKNAKLLVGAGIICAVLVLTGAALVSQAASSEHSQKPDIHKPIQATDVELVKKATIRGKAVGKGKPSPEGPSATGILGDYPVAGNKYAIVIGIADYPGTANDLKYTDEDAEEMIAALTNTYEFDPDNIRSFIDKEGDEAVNATEEKILAAIQEIGSVAGSGDEVVFFFSGHGGKGKANDGDKEAIDESIIVHDGTNLVYLWDGELRNAFSNFATSRIVFIFDSCVAGGMTDLTAAGRIINMATTETGTAYEFEELQNGQFTHYFVDEGMLQGLADKYDNLSGIPDVTIEEAFDYAKAKNVNQIPTIKDSFFNDLLL